MTALPRQDALFEVPSGQVEAETTGGASGEANGVAGSTGNLPPAISAAPKVAASKKPPVVKVGPARESQGCRDIYKAATGDEYRDNAKDVAVWKSLRAKHSVTEIEERFRVGLVSADKWLHIDNIWQLGPKWNELGALLAKSRPVGEVWKYACETCAVVVDTSLSGARRDSGGWACAKCWGDRHPPVPTPPMQWRTKGDGT